MSSGTYVQLREIFIAPADDLSNYVSIPGHELLGTDENATGEVREYAGGRFRAVSTKTTARTFDINLNYVEKADWEKLLEWTRQIVLFRDLKGKLVYGVFFQVHLADRGHGLLHRMVSFRLQEVTYDPTVV